MPLTELLLSARNEERIRQKASEENAEEEEDKDEVNFLVREDAATRENMVVVFMLVFRARFFISEMEKFFPESRFFPKNEP